MMMILPHFLCYFDLVHVFEEDEVVVLLLLSLLGHNLHDHFLCLSSWLIDQIPVLLL